jgi:hypothetical protein
MMFSCSRAVSYNILLRSVTTVQSISESSFSLAKLLVPGALTIKATLIQERGETRIETKARSQLRKRSSLCQLNLV